MARGLMPRAVGAISMCCDTKVDLLIKTPQDADQPIHQIARQGIQL